MCTNVEDIAKLVILCTCLGDRRITPPDACQRPFECYRKITKAPAAAVADLLWDVITIFNILRIGRHPSTITM